MKTIAAALLSVIMIASCGSHVTDELQVPLTAGHSSTDTDSIAKISGCWAGRNGGFVRFGDGELYQGLDRYTFKQSSLEKIPAYTDLLLEVTGGDRNKFRIFSDLFAIKHAEDGKNIYITSFVNEADYRYQSPSFNKLRSEDLFAPSDCYFPEILETEPIINTQSREYVGCWMGNEGNRVTVKSDGTFIFDGKLRYHELHRQTDSDGERYLLRAYGKISGYESDTHIFSIRPVPDKELVWFRYESEEDFLADRYTGIGEFSRIDCK